MELRTQINAPRRYDEPAPRTGRDTPEELLRKRRIKDPETTPYRIVKPIEYNPDLPPAVFPTIESWLPRKVDTATESSPSESLNIIPEGQSSQPGLRDRLDIASPKQMILDTKSQQVINQSSMSPSRRCSQRSHLAFSSESSDNAPGAGEEVQSNGLDDSVYQSNMEILERMLNRTESDWDLADMETSSEEGRLLTVSSAKTQEADTASNTCPDWDDLPISNQLDLINTLSEQFDGVQNAMSQLRLNVTQRHTMNEVLARQKNSLAEEDARIQALQVATNRILMADNSNKARHMSQAKYRELLNTYLYRTDEDGHYISTLEGLSKAKQYLQSCGHKPEILDPWSKDPCQIDDFGTGSAQLLPSAPVTRLQKAAQSIPITQYSDSGGSNIQNIVGQNPYRTSDEYATMLPLPTDTLRTPQANNTQTRHLKLDDRVEMDGVWSSVNQGHKSEGITLKDNHLLDHRPYTVTPRMSQPQDPPGLFIDHSVGEDLIAGTHFRAEPPRVSIPSPTINVISPQAQDDCFSYSLNTAPSIQAPPSSRSMLITPTRKIHSTTDPSPRKPLTLTVSQKDLTSEMPLHNKAAESPDKKKTSRSKPPAMLAALESSPGFKNEVVESSFGRSSRSSRGFYPPKP